MDNQQRPTVPHMELCSKSCGSLDGRGLGENDTGTWMAESLRSLPETTTVLLISYSPNTK